MARSLPLPKAPQTRPKHERLELELIKIIEKKSLKPHDVFLTEKAISERFGVNFLTARQSLASMDQKGLIYRIPRKGTFVAPRRKVGKILVVYAIAPQPNEALRFFRSYGETSFFMKMVEVASENKSGYDPVFISNVAYFSEIRKDLLHHYPDLSGVIFFRNIDLFQSSKAILENLGIPYFFYGSSMHLPKLTGVPRLLYDEDEINRLAMGHLAGAAHKRVGILYIDSSPIHFYRYQLARALLEKQGMEMDESLMLNVPYSSTSDLLQHRILSQKVGPFSLYATDDFFLAQSIQDLSRLGVRIPEDLAVLGVNNSPICEILHPGLDAIDLPLSEDAGRTYRAMVSLISNPKEIFDERSRVKLVQRGSTRPA